MRGGQQVTRALVVVDDAVIDGGVRRIRVCSKCQGHFAERHKLPHRTAAQALASQFGGSNAAPTLAELAVGKSNADYVLKLPASQRAPALDAIDLGYQVLVERRRAPLRRSCRSCI